MTPMKQAGPPIVALAALTIGYILGCSSSQREEQSDADQKQAATSGQDAEGESNKPVASESKHFHPKGKPPSKHTLAILKKARTEHPFAVTAGRLLSGPLISKQVPTQNIRKNP